MSVATSEDERRSTLSDWIVSGLQGGEGFVYTEPDGPPESGWLSTALDGTPVDIDRAHQDGLLLQIPMTDFYSVDAPPMLVDLAWTEGFRRLRIVADARHGLQVLDQPTYLKYERGLAGACATSPLAALCQFDGETASTWLSEVSLMHMGHGPASMFMAVPDDETVVLFGEVDITNDDRMTEALRLTAGRADGFMKVDLSGLTLLSAAGCRALIEGTDSYRARGGHVLLVGARPPVQRVLKLLGFDEAPGFTMARDSA
jgi:anti-anti-sigma factor